MGVLFDFIPLVCFFALAWIGLRKMPRTPAFVPPRFFLILIMSILIIFVSLLLLGKYGVIPPLPEP